MMQALALTILFCVALVHTWAFTPPRSVCSLRTLRIYTGSEVASKVSDVKRVPSLEGSDGGSDVPAVQKAVYKGSGPRVYTPRSQRNENGAPIGNVGNGGGGGGAPRTYKPRGSTSNGAPANGRGGAGRVYTPRNSAGPGGARPQGRSSVPALFLDAPQLLVRYRVPRVQSEAKQRMLDNQDALVAAVEAARGGGGSYYDYDGGGGWGGGGGAPGKDNFMAKFGNAGRQVQQRKGSEGARPSTDNKRASKRDLQQDEDDDEEYIGEGDDEEAFFDDEAFVSFSSVPTGALLSMQQQGQTFEAMQLQMYAAYGVKASVIAIRRRLAEERYGGKRKGKKKTGKTRKDRAKRRSARMAGPADNSVVLPEGPVPITELAELIGQSGAEVVKYLMLQLGIMSSINQSVAPDVAQKVAVGFGKEPISEADAAAMDDDEEDGDDDDEEAGAAASASVAGAFDATKYEQVPRAPIVTIMGHVDHGKTTLLDTIRNARVAAGEAGGITQAISAFRVQTEGGQPVTFLDTPGHAAFSDMRRRGADATDIVVLVIAADDGVMEQTKECISAAKMAGCPVVVAINKIDKEGADAQRIMTELTKHDIIVEDLGGETQCVSVSAKGGLGIDSLLEKISLQSELLRLTAPVDCEAEGTVIEARVAKGLGPVVTTLVRRGTLKTGQYVLAGSAWGRVRRLTSTTDGSKIDSAGPSEPVDIVGLSTIPDAGTTLIVGTTEASVRDVAESRARLQRQSAGQSVVDAVIATASGFRDGRMDTREVIKVPLIIKADVAGSVEAVKSSIEALAQSDDEAICIPDIVYAGVGDVTSSDVSIAATAKAKVLAFGVAAAGNAIDEARAQNVDIGYYSVVYELLDELEKQITVTLSPPPPGTLVGRATIGKIFRVGKVGRVAGCEVTEGTLKMDSRVRVMRGMRNQVYLGKLSSLKVVKDSVAEVAEGNECGLAFDEFQDFEEGDVIECFVGGSAASEEKV